MSWSDEGRAEKGVTMYLFARNVLITGDPRKALPVAVGMGELVTKKTQLQVSLWTTVFGAPLGTLGYTTLVPSLAELDAADSALMADEEYLDRLHEAQEFVAEPPVDQVVEILHNSGGEYRRADVGAVANVVTAQVANARYGAAIKWSFEMADLAAEITGTPGMFGRSVAGEFGTVAWVSTVPNMAALDRVNEALGEDPRYIAKLDEMGDIFLPGSGRTSITRRIA